MHKSCSPTASGTVISGLNSSHSLSKKVMRKPRQQLCKMIKSCLSVQCLHLISFMSTEHLSSFLLDSFHFITRQVKAGETLFSIFLHLSKHHCVRRVSEIASTCLNIVFAYPLQVIARDQKSLSRENVSIMHNSSVEGVEDMAHLEDLHEAGILHNLHVRYKKDLIYVRHDLRGAVIMIPANRDSLKHERISRDGKT